MKNYNIIMDSFTPSVSDDSRMLSVSELWMLKDSTPQDSRNQLDKKLK